MKLVCEFENVESLKTKAKAVFSFDKTLCHDLNQFGDKPIILTIANKDTGEATQVPAEIVKIRSLKAIGKAELVFDRDKYGDVVKFNCGQVLVEILVDTPEQLKRMSQISGEQRRKIFALINEMAYALVENRESFRENITGLYCFENQLEVFSLSDCSKEIASDFIEWLIGWAFEQGLELQDKPKDYFDDIERYHAICIKHLKCCVCGQHGEVHHLEGSRIGMGRNRHKVDDSKAKTICLCRPHHSELHNVPEQEFLGKYHL